MKFLRYIFVLVAIASSVEFVGQNVSGSYENKSLAFVLEDIGTRYDLSFAYDSDALSSIVGSWEIDNYPIDEALKLLLSKDGLEWKRVSETIVIYFTEEESNALPNVSGKERSMLYGEVRDQETNELLPFAVIATKNGKHFTSTNSDGKFALNSQMINDTLVFNYVGYDRKELILKKDIVYSKVYLNQRNTSLPTITIESMKVRLVESSPFPSIQTINPNNIAGIIGGGEADIYRAVQMLPGVAGTMESNNGLFVRGSNSDQTLITFDGFTLYQQDHFFGAFSAVNSTAVKNMRIHKGNMDARFGGRIAGVLEIVGNEGNGTKAKTQIDLGPLSVAGLIETPLDKDGKATAVIAGRRSFTNTVFSPTYRRMFNTVYNASVNVQPDNNLKTFGNNNDPEFFFQDLNFKLTYRSSERDVVNLSFFAAKDKLYMQYADTSSFEVVNLQDVNYTDESVKRNIGTGLRWSHRWNNNIETLASFGFSRFSGDYFSTDSIQEIGFQDTTVMFYSENAKLDDLDARFELNVTVEKHRLQSGVQFNHLSTFNKLNFLGASIPSRTQQGGILSIYFQDEIEWRERWSFKPGFRLNYFNLANRFDPEPRLAMGYKIIPHTLRLKASIGIIHQYIHRIREQSIYFNTPDYWQYSGNDNLPVLRSLQYAFGGVVNLESWVLDVEGYIKKNSGLFVNAGIYGKTDSARYQSLIFTGEGTTYGMDMLLQRDWKRQHAWLGYTLTYSRNSFETDIGSQMIREPFIRQHEAKLYYEFRPKKWSFSALWIIGSGKAFTPYLGTYDYELPNGTIRRLPVFGDLNSGLLEPYHRLDISAAYHFSLKRTRGKLQFSVFNVYNHENVRDIQYIAVRDNDDNNDYRVVERKVNMLPFLPSINLQMRF